LRELYKIPDLVMDVKRRSMEWLGYVIRMDQARVEKKNFGSKMEERRNVGTLGLR
jgi:hypothetical protein